MTGHWIVPKVEHDENAPVTPHILSNFIYRAAGQSTVAHTRHYAAQLLAAADELERRQAESRRDEPTCCGEPMVHNSFTGQNECMVAFTVLHDEGIDPYLVEPAELEPEQRAQHAHWMASRRDDGQESGVTAPNPSRCVASKHIPTTGAVCSVCGAPGMQHEDDRPGGGR